MPEREQGRWRAFGDGRELAICTAWDGDGLVGAFPLCRRGGDLEAMQNVHSPVFRLIARLLRACS